MRSGYLLFLPILVLSYFSAWAKRDDEDWVKLPDKCEVCKFVATELKNSFDETGKTKEVIDNKYGFMEGKGSKIKYKTSDLRLIEVTETICKRILDYSLHKERPGSNRFAKGMPETFQTLHNLVHKGVKVVMDIPYELWNETSAEVADLKKQCDVMVEEYEDVIEDWYKNHQEEDLTSFLCEKHVLKDKEKGCLQEVWSGKKGDMALMDEEKKKKKKGKESKDKRDSGDEGKKKKSKKEKHMMEESDKEMTSDDEEDVQEKVVLTEKTEL